MRTETDIVIDEVTDGNGGTVFAWKFTIDGETYADGHEATRAEANNKARAAREEWEYRNA